MPPVDAPARRCASPSLGVAGASSCRSRRSRRSRCSAPTPTSRRWSSPPSACCAARSPARVFGFGVGLFVDLALVQTLGLSLAGATSPSATGAGRLRELRDPQAALVPSPSARPPPRSRRSASALIQFLLGVDAPGELPAAARRSSSTILLNTLLALPVYALVRRWLPPVLPEDPRRRRRRAYTTGGLRPLQPRLMRARPRRRPPPADHAAARAARRRSLGGSRSRCSRSSSSACGSCRSSPATSTSPQADDNRVRDDAHPGAARRIVDRNGHELVDNRMATVVQIDPRRSRCRARRRRAWGQQLTARACGPRASKGPPAAAAAAHAELAMLFGAWAACCRCRPRRSTARRASIAPGALRRRHAQDRRRRARSATTSSERQDAVPGRQRRRSVYLRSYPHGTSPRRSSAPSGEIIRDAAQGQSATRASSQGTIVGQSGLESAYDRYLRGRDGAHRIEVNAGRRTAPRRRRARPRPGSQLKLTLDLGLQQAGEEALQAIGRRRRCAGAFVAMNPRQRRGLRDGLAARATTRASFARPFSSPAAYNAKFGTGRRRAADQPRDPAASIRPARSSSRSPRWPHCRPA